MLVQFAIMGSRPSAAYFSDGTSIEPIHLDLNSGSIQHDDGVYKVEAEVRGVLPPTLIEKLMQYRGFDFQVNSNYCFSPNEPHVTTDLTLLLPCLELIQVQPHLIVARSELNEGSNLAMEMAQAGYQSQLRHYNRYGFSNGQPRDREAIGNAQCKFNALSRHLRCTANPFGPCEGCEFFEPRV